MMKNPMGGEWIIANKGLVKRWCCAKCLQNAKERKGKIK
jgi:hypothetical protein